MSVYEMWKSGIITKIMVIFVGLIAFSFGVKNLWIVLGLLGLLGGCFLAFRQGQGFGHEACAMSKSAQRMQEIGDQAGLSDTKLLKKTWSIQNGIKALFAGASISYIINCMYILFVLLKLNENAVIVMRIISWGVTMPFWPIIAFWHEEYVSLTPDLVAVLMISPFILPAFQFAGYRMGPRLWAKTEEAMLQGKRRAKARSRIGRKQFQQTPRKPQI